MSKVQIFSIYISFDLDNKHKIKTKVQDIIMTRPYLGYKGTFYTISYHNNTFYSEVLTPTHRHTDLVNGLA